jgi:host factor-I protein
MPDAIKPNTPKAESLSPDKASLNIQDNFLNAARKERQSVTIFLLGGVKLSGKIRSFDKYSVILESNHQEQLIFKHAISTITLSRPAPGPGAGAEA